MYNAKAIIMLTTLCFIVTASVAAPKHTAEKPAPIEEKSTGLITGNFKCALGHRIDVTSDAAQNDAIMVTWKGHPYSLRAVDTTTGALRYEDTKSGMVWLQIAKKSMLLNIKAGQQVANDCLVMAAL